MEVALILPVAAVAAYRRWRPAPRANWQSAAHVDQEGATATSAEQDLRRCAGRSAGRKLLVSAEPSLLSSLAAGAWAFVVGGTDDSAWESEKVALSEEREAAREVVGAFCGAWSAVIVEPAADELERLWWACTDLADEALADAIAEQLVVIGADGGVVEWQQHLRALHAANYISAQGGRGRAAARSALSEAEPLLRHLTAEVGRCREQAMKALLVLHARDHDVAFVDRDHDADRFDEGPRGVAPVSPMVLKVMPSMQPVALLGDEAGVEETRAPTALSCREGLGQVPLLPVPKPPSASMYEQGVKDEELLMCSGSGVMSDSMSTRAASDIDSLEGSGLADAHFDGLVVYEDRASAARIAPIFVAFDRAAPLVNSGAEVSIDDLDHALGFHWLEASRMASALPEPSDPFAFARLEFDSFQAL